MFRLEGWKKAVKTAKDKHSGAIKVVFDHHDKDAQ